MVIKFYNIFSTFTTEEWYSYFCTGKKKNSKQKSLLYDCFQHFVLNYPFLDETQQWGKAYQLLGIPQVCGKVDKEKLKKMYVEHKKNNARIPKLKVQFRPGKMTMNNQICEEDWKSVNVGQQYTKPSKILPQEELRKPYSNKIVKNRQTINGNQINHGQVSVLDQVYKSEIQSKKRVRFNNVQILCFDKSISSESDETTGTLLINETSKQNVNNKNERIIHKPYFERLNDSVSSESTTDIEVNNNLTPSSESLIEAEKEFNLNEGKPDHKDDKELPIRKTQSNGSDISKLFDILSDQNDSKILSPCDETYNKNSGIYSSSNTQIKIIPSLPSGNEEDDTLSSDSLMNDHDTGIISPYTSDDESRVILDDKEPTTMREQDGEKIENEVTETKDKINDNQRKSTITLELRNSDSEELLEDSENSRESSTEKIYSTSDEYPTKLKYLFTDRINFREKNINIDVDSEISKIKHQNSNKEEHKESNDNSSGDIQENFVSYINPCDGKCEENEAEDQIPRESGKGNIVDSPLSSESSVDFISLIPSGNLMSATIMNIENFRLNRSASLSQESSFLQEEFGFGNNVIINKSSVLDRDNKKEQILSSDSINQSNRNQEETKENNLISNSRYSSESMSPDSNEELLNDPNKKNQIEIIKKTLERKVTQESKESSPIIISDTEISSSDNFNQSSRNQEQTKEKNLISGLQCSLERMNSNSNEVLLNDPNKKNQIEIKKGRLENKKGSPIIISDTETTTTSSSENIIRSSLVVDSNGTKREPLRSISNVINKGKNSPGMNIIGNRDLRDKENIDPDMSDQISPKRNMPREAALKSLFISDSSSHELDNISGLEEESNHDEDVVPSSCDSTIAVDNNGTAKIGKVAESGSSKEKFSLNSVLGTGKNYKKLFQKSKNSTNENPSSDKNDLILSTKISGPEEARETGFVNQVIVLSDNSEISTFPNDLNKKEKGDKYCENLQEEPNICESMKENRTIKDISSKNTGKTTQMSTKKVLTFNTAPMTINSSDSWSSKEYLLKNFNNRISNVGKLEEKEIAEKSSDIMGKLNCFENLNNRDACFAERRSRGSIVRTIISVLNDPNLSPELKESEEESVQYSINSSIGEISTQLAKVDVTDLGVNAYFNDPMTVSLESSSNSSICGTTPDYNNCNRISSTVTQQINNLNLINPETSSRNCESQLLSDTGQHDHKNYSPGSNDDVAMENIDINKRETISMNVSNNVGKELDSVNPLNKYKRKVSSADTIIKCLDMAYHDADTSSDSSTVLSHKKIKRRRKKASRVVVKLKNIPDKHNNKHRTSSDSTEFINEILNEKIKKKLKPKSDKATITNPMLINVMEKEKTTGNEPRKMQQSISVDKNPLMSNNNNNSSGMINVEQYDSIGGQHISQELKKLRTSIVKQQINSSDTSTTSEYISSALARRIYYLKNL